MPELKHFLVTRSALDGTTLAPQHCNIATASLAARRKIGAEEKMKWIASGATSKGLVCAIEADSEDTVRAHSEAGGFPVTTVEEVSADEMLNALSGFTHIFGPGYAKQPEVVEQH